MKRLNLLALILILGIAFVSCEKSDDSEFDVLSKSKLSENSGGQTAPSGVASVTPVIIPGENSGGNRTCAEVGAYFKNDPAYFDYCGDRVDYEDFANGFPGGLNVTSDGKTLSFKADDCIIIGDKFYKVGAVIVKGGSSANVYFYEEGILADQNLTAPVNASGKPAGISNVTFCFILCDPQPKLVIAFKSYLSNTNWVCTTGGPGNIGFVAYYDFKEGNVGKVYLSANTSPATGDLTKPVGNITVADIDDDGLWEVTVDNLDNTALLYTDAYLFVGSLEKYNTLYYTAFPYKTGVVTPTSTLTFQLPF